MAIAFDAASSSGYEASLSTYSWSHICSGDNRGLLVAVSIFLTGTVTSITYNSVNLASIGAAAQGVYRIEWWGLRNPDQGANTVVVTLSASVTSIASAVSYTDINQTKMVDVEANLAGTGGSPTSSISTNCDKDFVLCAISTADTTTAATSPAVSRANNSGALGSGAISEKATISPSASVSMGWDDVGPADDWAISLVAIRPQARKPAGLRVAAGGGLLG